MNKTVEATLRLSSKLGSMRAFDQISGKMDKVNKQAKAFNRSQMAMNKAVSAVPIGRFLGPAALAYAGTASLKRYAEVERQFTRIGLTLGANREQSEALQKSAAETARRYALSADAVAETVAAYAAAGADLGDINADIDLLAKAQQALDASGRDVVNSWDAARKSLGLTSKDAERFFELVGAGSAAGKFEANDLAQYLPSLLPSASKQGFSGLGGISRIISFLEVMADATGSSGQAATAVGDFLEKLSSPDVERNLNKISDTFVKRMKEARKNGDDMLQVVHDILREVTKGDAAELGKIFGDKEARAAATVILTQFDRIKRAQDEIEANAPQLLDRNNARLMENAEASIARMSAAYDKLLTNVGGVVAGPAVPIMDAINNKFEFDDYLKNGLKKQGLTGNAALDYLLKNPGDRNLIAFDAGWRERDANGNRYVDRPRMASPDAGMDFKAIPIPYDPPDRMPIADQYTQYGKGRRAASKQAASKMRPLPAYGAAFREAENASMATLRIDHNRIANEVEMALADTGRDFGQSARTAIDAQALGAAFGAAVVAKVLAGISNITVNVRQSGATPVVNVNSGRTMPHAGRAGGPD